jgi:hypothetical protein
VKRLRCVDGSYLGVEPVVCRDSAGTPYEITLELHRDGLPYGVVGERCGWFLARLARGIARARADDGPQAAGWPDPEDRFPATEDEGELFAFRCRARTDVVGGGELRCRLRVIPSWIPRQRSGDGPRGEWRLSRRAFLEAWSASGVGLRAELTSAQLAGFVQGLVDEAEERLGVPFMPECNLIESTGSPPRPR